MAPGAHAPPPVQVLTAVWMLLFAPSTHEAARHGVPEPQFAQPDPPALHAPVGPHVFWGVAVHALSQQRLPSQLLFWHCPPAVHTPPLSSWQVTFNDVTAAPGTMAVAVVAPPAKLHAWCGGCDAMLTVYVEPLGTPAEPGAGFEGAKPKPGNPAVDGVRVTVSGVVTAGLSVNCSVIAGLGETELANETVPPTAKSRVVHVTVRLLRGALPTVPTWFARTQLCAAGGYVGLTATTE